MKQPDIIDGFCSAHYNWITAFKYYNKTKYSVVTLGLKEPLLKLRSINIIFIFAH